MNIQGSLLTFHYKKGEQHSNSDWISGAWHITDFVAETREDLEMAIRPVDNHVEAPVKREWSSAH